MHVLFVHANPDGNDLVADWYMRNADPEKRSATFLPRLYQKYIGHDNNRDFFASTQAETENINRVLDDGSFYINGASGIARVLENAASELGVTFTSAGSVPMSAAPLRAPRIGLWDQYGGSIRCIWREGDRCLKAPVPLEHLSP